ncbi:MAG: N-acetylmuramoyl-L-alanine amidase [Planctomycetota bacterium]
MRILAIAIALVLASPAFAEPVTVADFARRHGLIASRDAASGRDLLKGASTVVLAPGMSIAVVDGRVIALSEEVRVENGRTVMSQEDASKLAGCMRESEEPRPAPRYEPDPPPAPSPAVKKAPIVKQAPAAVAKKPGKFREVVIDPGHGGVHTGGKGAKGTMEKDIVLDVAMEIRDILREAGIKVTMTRETDRHLAPEVRDDLKARVDFTEKHDPDLFLSIHSNWAENKGAQGFEVFYPRAGCEGSATERETGRKLAEQIRKTFADRFDTPDRGVKEAGFMVIKNAPCPAVLVELEFVSNPTGERNLRDGGYRKRLAAAVADAVLQQSRK